MIENTSLEGVGLEWSWEVGEGMKESRSEAPALAQTTLQGIRAHPGSRMVSLKNFSNHF